MTDLLKEAIVSKNVKLLETLIITHPKFTQDWHIVNDTEDHLLYPAGLGNLTKFISVPFSISLPEVGSAQQDIDVILPNIDFALQKELDAAKEQPEPVKVVYSIYIEDDENPHATVNGLEFKNISAGVFQIQAKASRPDLFEKKILQNTFDFRFEGLWV